MNVVHVYHAIRRQKENEVIFGPRIIREVDSYKDPISILKKATADITGTWRIYRSVNRRDVKKSELELIKTLIDRNINPGSASDKPVGSLWKTILMQPRNKADRFYLIDLDTKDPVVYADIMNLLLDHDIEAEFRETPNGHHFIAKPFDVRLVEKYPDVTVNKDGLLFIEKYEV